MKAKQLSRVEITQTNNPASYSTRLMSAGRMGSFGLLRK